MHAPCRERCVQHLYVPLRKKLLFACGQAFVVEIDTWPTEGQELIVGTGEVSLLTSKEFFNVCAHVRFPWMFGTRCGGGGWGNRARLLCPQKSSLRWARGG